ncbi:hypothetical protein [Candidatus Lokiarchaeum ossiferum]|uniref:hypothetical protein n=1 Tax=Candidatus Lokiarchaeum ossiferum TaxID=2951803 RepID=UPI00352E1940
MSSKIAIFKKLTPLLNKIYVRAHTDIDNISFQLPSEWNEKQIEVLMSNLNLPITEISSQDQTKILPGKFVSGEKNPKKTKKEKVPVPEDEKNLKPITFGEPFQKLQKDKFNTIRLGAEYIVGNIHPIILKHFGYMGKAKILKRKLFEYQFVPKNLLILDTETNNIEEAKAKMKHYYPKIHPHRMVSVLLLEWVK